MLNIPSCMFYQLTSQKIGQRTEQPAKLTAPTVFPLREVALVNLGGMF